MPHDVVLLRATAVPPPASPQRRSEPLPYAVTRPRLLLAAAASDASGVAIPVAAPVHARPAYAEDATIPVVAPVCAGSSRMTSGRRRSIAVFVIFCRCCKDLDVLRLTSTSQMVMIRLLCPAARASGCIHVRSRVALLLRYQDPRIACQHRQGRSLKL